MTMDIFDISSHNKLFFSERKVASLVVCSVRMIFKNQSFPTISIFCIAWNIAFEYDSLRFVMKIILYCQRICCMYVLLVVEEQVL